MDYVPAGYVLSSCMAVVFVGPRHDLVFRPDCVVLGHGDYEGMRLASGIGGALADDMGKAVKKAREAALFLNRPIRAYPSFYLPRLCMIT